jgi:soluble lytic murein transglycosylase
MPPTGRQLARRLKLRYSYASLKRADFNLRLGSFYLGNLISSFGGKIEDALAAYNAGPSRPPKWRQWGDFRDNEEFIETIPFTQTRDYVQILLRNADVYRWLYSGTPVLPEPAAAKRTTTSKKKTSTAKKPARKPAVRKSSSATKRK